MEIGERIKAARKKRGLTQKQLAKRIGKSLRMLQKYEDGEATPSVPVLKIISGALDIEFDDLVRFTKGEYITLPLCDWLDSLGYRVIFRQSSDEPYIRIHEIASFDDFYITDEQLDFLEKSISAYTRFQVLETIMQAQPSPLSEGEDEDEEE